MSTQVKCPNCTNKRLFDVVTPGKIEMDIKCPRCRKVINLIIANNAITAQTVQ